MSRILPISHEIATRLAVPIGPRGIQDVTSGAVHLLLGVLSRFAVIADDPEEAFARRCDRLAFDELSGAGSHMESVHLSWPVLRDDLCMTGPEMFGALSRAAQLKACVAGWAQVPDIMRTTGYSGWKTLTTMSTKVLVEARLAYAAHVYGDAGTDSSGGVVWWDSEAVSRMRGRYAPLAYLRALAWLAAPERIPEDWGAHRTRTGALAMDIPIEQAPLALGVHAMPWPAVLEASVVKAVSTDLATAGIRWDGALVRNRRGEATAVKVVVARVEAQPRQRQYRGRLPLEERARRRRVRLAETLLAQDRAMDLAGTVAALEAQRARRPRASRSRSPSRA